MKRLLLECAIGALMVTLIVSVELLIETLDAYEETRA